jgi:hypothetical protein
MTMKAEERSQKMKEKPPIKDILLQVAEEDVHHDYDPWEVIQRRLKTAQADQAWRNKRPTAISLQRPQLAGIAVVTLVFLAGVIFLTTPEGKVAAEGFLHLFANTQKNTLPLPTGVPAGAVHPTQTPGPLSQETPTLQPTLENGSYVYSLTLAGAKTLAGYPVRVLAGLPDGFRRADISFDKQTHAVTQLYDYLPSPGPYISVQQSPTLEMQPIGPSAVIHQFQAGDITVEWVDGGWYIPLGAAQQEWEPELPVRTFRWAQDGLFFTLLFIPTTPSGPLTLDEMKTLVESMIGIR